MAIFETVLILATFLCSLVAGFLFAFAVVAMPGIKKLNDREFIRAFQAMDRIIQDNQPLFLFVWIGSAVALVSSAFLGIGEIDRVGQVLLLSATASYLAGVQLPTLSVNIPLNNKLQTVNVDNVDELVHRTARGEFESRWNRWNVIRAVLSSLTSALLIILLLRI